MEIAISRPDQASIVSIPTSTTGQTRLGTKIWCNSSLMVFIAIEETGHKRHA